MFYEFSTIYEEENHVSVIKDEDSRNLNCLVLSQSLKQLIGFKSLLIKIFQKFESLRMSC